MRILRLSSNDFNELSKNSQTGPDMSTIDSEILSFNWRLFNERSSLSSLLDCEHCSPNKLLELPWQSIEVKENFEMQSV